MSDSENNIEEALVDSETQQESPAANDIEHLEAETSENVSDESSNTIEGFDMEHLFDSWDPYNSDKKKNKIKETPVIGNVYQKHTSSKSYIKQQQRTPFERKDRQFKICVAIIFIFVFIIALVSSSFFTGAKQAADREEAIVQEKSQEDLDNMKATGTNPTFVNTLQNKKETLTVTVTAPEAVRDTQAELVVKGTSASGESINRIFHVPLNEPKEISITQGLYTLYFTYALKDSQGKNYMCNQVEELTLDGSGKELFFEYVPV